VLYFLVPGCHLHPGHRLAGVQDRARLFYLGQHAFGKYYEKYNINVTGWQKTGMLVYLESINPSKNRFRFYILHLGPNLFGGWSVEQVWGRIGAHNPRRRIHLCETKEEAEELLARHLRKRLKRGYEVVWRRRLRA